MLKKLKLNFFPYVHSYVSALLIPGELEMLRPSTTNKNIYLFIEKNPVAIPYHFPL